MDFSFRSLQMISGSKQDRTRANANWKEGDKLASVMRTVRAIIQDSNQASLAINEIFKRMRKNKNELTNVEELKEAMRYYAKMQVVFIDDDEQISLL